MRVYLPATLPLLGKWWRVGEIGPPPMSGCSLTPALREWYATGDEEELEYSALLAAARSSLRLLSFDDEAPRRRVVVALEAPGPSVVAQPELGPAGVRLTEAVPLSRVAAVHVDDAEAEAVVRVAVSAIGMADLGDGDAQFDVEAAEGSELLWYATQEVPALLGGSPDG
jgi:hypothetical protein